MNISKEFDVWGPGCDPRDYDNQENHSGVIIKGEDERRPIIDEYAENGVSIFDFF